MGLSAKVFYPFGTLFLSMSYTRLDAKKKFPKSKEITHNFLPAGWLFNIAAHKCGDITRHFSQLVDKTDAFEVEASLPLSFLLLFSKLFSSISRFLPFLLTTGPRAGHHHKESRRVDVCSRRRWACMWGRGRNLKEWRERERERERERNVHPLNFYFLQVDCLVRDECLDFTAKKSRFIEIPNVGFPMDNLKDKKFGISCSIYLEEGEGGPVFSIVNKMEFHAQASGYLTIKTMTKKKASKDCD